MSGEKGIKGFGPFPVESYETVEDTNKDSNGPSEPTRTVTPPEQVLGPGFVDRFNFDGV